MTRSVRKNIPFPHFPLFTDVVGNLLCLPETPDTGSVSGVPWVPSSRSLVFVEFPRRGRTTRTSGVKEGATADPDGEQRGPGWWDQSGPEGEETDLSRGNGTLKIVLF